MLTHFSRRDGVNAGQPPTSLNQGIWASGMRVSCDGEEQSLVHIDVTVTVAGPYLLTIQERQRP
jgi:hypothetical protein